MSIFNKLCFISVILIFALGSGMSLKAQCNVYNEDTSECFSTIQAAIDDADTDAGDTITVYSGTFNEQVTIDKSITLQGSGSFTTRIEDDTTPGVLLITADDVVVKNIGIIWKGSYGGYYYGVKIESDDCVLENLLVAEAKRNIYIYGGSGNTVKSSLITTDVGVDHEAVTIIGSNNTICGNTIISSNDTIGFGIVLVGSTTGNDIVGNDIRNFQYGIYVWIANNNNIYRNNFINNDYHAYAYMTSPNYNNWDDGGAYGGNFWENVTCTDNDWDGFGDYAYTIATGESDNYPLCCRTATNCL